MLLDLKGFSVEYIQSISALIDRYDALLVDVWGVLHDGVQPYPGVIDCLSRLREGGKRIVLLSNSARRVDQVEQDLAGFGIVPGLYDCLVTSGELTRSAFEHDQDNNLARLGSCYYLLGSEKYGLTYGLDICGTSDLTKADLVLAIGIEGNPSSTEAQEKTLQEAVDRGLTMVCANPDISVNRSGVLGIGPGALAARYEELGGQVIYFGKPYRAIYQHCLQLLGTVIGSRMVAVGDSLRTDIAGARANGLDSLLVGTGVHAKELDGIPGETARFSELCRREGSVPNLLTKRFAW